MQTLFALIHQIVMVAFTVSLAFLRRGVCGKSGEKIWGCTDKQLVTGMGSLEQTFVPFKSLLFVT